MELVEGPTLAEQLESGALPLNESLAVSLQIAHALEEAHEKGIVHRDLKPQNIKASIEGKVKVLDFGLAKAMDPDGTASGSGAASQLATWGAALPGRVIAMISAIETTMDQSGRLVVPKAVREAAGLVAGMPLAIRITEGGIEIAPAPRAVRTVRRGRLTVAIPVEAGPALSTGTVRQTQSLVRRER